MVNPVNERSKNIKQGAGLMGTNDWPEVCSDGPSTIPSQSQLINAGLWNIYLEMRGVQAMNLNIRKKSRTGRAKFRTIQ